MARRYQGINYSDGGHSFSMSIDGLDDLMDSLENLTKKYPDKAGDLLKKDARDLRKDVVKKTKQVTKTNSSSKKSLGKVGAYKISPVQGFGSNQFVEVSAKSPHFHLVEHGHVLKSHDGQTIGFVQGKHMLADTVKKHQESMPETVSNMVDELLKEEGLI